MRAELEARLLHADKMLGMDELIYPILLFRDQGTIELEVWTDGAVVGLWCKTWLTQWVTANCPRGCQQ